MTDRKFGFKTRALHAGGQPDSATGARAVPIYQSTSFVFEDTQDAADLFALQKYGTIYSRISNPTVAAFEERMASLEGGIGAVATASGQAAEFLTVTALAGAGDHVVASSNLYGGTYTQFDVTLRRLGIEVDFVDASDPAAFAAAVRDETKLIYTEMIGNPTGVVADLEALSEVAHGARPAARRRQHLRDAVPVPPDRARRRHRAALGDQVHRRTRHRYRRSHRRSRHLRLGQRPLPAHDRAGAELQRLALVGQLRRVRLLYQGARRTAA